MHIKENQAYFGTHSATELASEFGTPLFVYEESVLRERCKALKSLVKRSKYKVNYSFKANNNIAILKIMREEGFSVDAMSPGEVYLEELAGFTKEEMLYISNNMTKEELQFVVDKGLTFSADSLNQLEAYGKINPGSRVFVRINPAVEDGHHAKVKTGYKCKFGIVIDEIPTIHQIAEKYGMKIIGINMHVGSLFLQHENFLKAIQKLLDVALQFDELEVINFGGGIGIPYHKDTSRFSIAQFAEVFDQTLFDWRQKNKKGDITFMIEPGRYPVAESGTLLGTVTDIKTNYDVKYIGTDLGMNVLLRPVMYGSYHEVVVCNNAQGQEKETVTVCGNICEAGDIMAKDRLLPKIQEDDVLAVLDAGAYGYAMASNYNSRLRPMEIMVCMDGSVKVIRERERVEDLAARQVW